MGEVIENAKSAKVGVTAPHLRVWVGVGVVLWWGCGMIRGVGFIICGLEKELR